MVDGLVDGGWWMVDGLPQDGHKAEALQDGEHRPSRANRALIRLWYVSLLSGPVFSIFALVLIRTQKRRLSVRE